jgi:hypothetical protein
MGAKKHVVELSAEDRNTLEWFISTGERKSEDNTRARILLKADDGLTDSKISEHVGCHPKTVYNTRKTYAELGLAAVHRRQQSLPPFPTQGLRLRRWSGFFTLPPRRQAQRDPAGRRAPAVPGLVGDDAQHPGPKGGVGAEAPEGVERLHEAVLGGLLGLGGRAGDQVRGSKRDRLVLLHEGLVRSGVAALRERDELGLRQWPVPHCTRYTPPGGRGFPSA